jgi:hypothetical protein
MNNTGKNPLLIKLILLFSSISICLIAAEFILQRFIPIDDGTSHEFRIPHPTLGWVLEPGASYHNTLDEETVLVQYNSGGWRDYEHPVENTREFFRILVLGDSFMEAYSVNFNESFSQRLEYLAGKDGYNVEVFNFGVGGYGSLQEYIAFNEKGKQYRPDLVLLGFFVGNDVRNNSIELESVINKGKARPFLYPGAALWEITPIDYTGAMRDYKAARARLGTLTHKIAVHSLILSKASEELNRMISKLSDDREEDPKITDKKLEELSLRGVHYCDEPVEYTRAWGTTERILSRLKKDVEAIGGKLAVFTVPSLVETVFPDKREDILSSGNLCMEDPPGYKRLNRLLAELDINLIDLLPEFRIEKKLLNAPDKPT